MSKVMKMPSAVSEIHEKLRREVVFLYTKSQWFKKLYCTDDETVQLLDSAASFFFLVYSEMLRDDIIMTVCRLTDPAKTKVKKAMKNNLTVKYLVEIIPPADRALQSSLRSLLTCLDSHCQPFRKHRNLRIGHCDFEVRLKRSASLLPDIGLDDVDQALGSIAAVLNAVEMHYCGNEQSYKKGVYGSGNAEDLIKFIKRKKRLEKEFKRKEFGHDTDGES